MLDAISAHASHALSLMETASVSHASDRIQSLLDCFNLRIKDVSPTSSLLFGADACIDPTSQTIRIRRDINPLYRREVLAHELAHAILGHDHFGEVLQSRDYVSAYGRNERIERMADNLAAQLLVTEGDIENARITCRTFSSAAELLGVSKATLIRRLTQHRSPVTDKPMDRHPLLPHQQDAVDWVGGVCIDGGVGTGKTEVLLARLLRLTENAPTGHSRILFVTYLRRNMVYLFERMARIAPLIAERVNFTTFHDYAADIILRNAAKVGCSGKPTIVGRGEVVEMLRKSFPGTSAEHIQHMSLEYRQGLRHESSDCEPWVATLTEQLYQLNYIHNGSLGTLAFRLMQSDGISSDEADRWDAIFVDSYEQLTYNELSVLRHASTRARYGVSASSCYSELPYTFRGVSVESADQWKQDCALKCFDFGCQDRLRPVPRVAMDSCDDAVMSAITTVKGIVEQSTSDEKIIVAVRHNTLVARLRDALATELPELVPQDDCENATTYSLYARLDAGASFDDFLDDWWQMSRNCSDAEITQLQTALANCQMYKEHRTRSMAIGLPTVSLATYMESIRPHHQYLDIQLPERISIQTLHSLSGGEAEHVVLITDGLTDFSFDLCSLTPTDRALFENACARARKTLTVIHSTV